MRQSGIVLALFSAVLFGVSTPLAKLLLGQADPWFTAGGLYLGAGCGLALVHGARNLLKLPAVEAPLRRSDMPWLALVVLAGGMIGPLLLMLGLQRTAATGASLLLNLEGLATMGLAWLAFRENVDRAVLTGAAAILAGAVVLSWPSAGQGDAQFSWGALLIAGACLAWGIDNNLTRKLSSADPVQIAMLKGLIAGSVNLVFALLHGAAVPGLTIIAAIGAVGFFGYGISLVLFVLALRHLGAARTSAYFSLAPFAGALFAIAATGEPVTLNLVIAGGLMAVGLWLHIAERHDHEHRHESMEHEHSHRHDGHHQHTHADDTASDEPHSHRHTHKPMAHAHPHFPDLHHRHGHTHSH